MSMQMKASSFNKLRCLLTAMQLMKSRCDTEQAPAILSKIFKAMQLYKKQKSVSYWSQ